MKTSVVPSSPRIPYRARTLGAVGAAALFAGIVGAPSAAVANDGVFVAEYADAVFEKRGAVLHIAPGEINDQGTVSEVLETRISQETCAKGYLITSEVVGSEEAPDLEGVSVDSRGGVADVAGTFTLVGEVTITPAGYQCENPIDSAAVSAPLSVDVTVEATWKNKPGSVPIVYSGEDCGGDGVCYYRDARAWATWSSDFLGEFRANSSSGFFFEGTYSAGSAAAAQLPQV